MSRLTLATALVFAAGNLAVPVAWGQDPVDHEAHHPAQSAPAPTQRAQPTPLAGQRGGMTMNILGAREMIQMMGPGMAGIDHIEGRIAFLRTELKITDAQAGTWNAFADALRANAKNLGSIRDAMMRRPGAGPTISARLDLQERWLLASLEGTRTIKAAFANLSDALSDEQKQVAEDLLPSQMGMGMMSMQQMRPDQMMQSGQMMQPPATPPAAK